MFIQVSILFLIILIIYLITKNIIVSNHKLYLNKSKIKYSFNDSDKRYLEKYSINCFLADIKEIGEDIYERNILHFCFSKKQLTYYEINYQIKYNVLEVDSYNDNILGKFYRKDLI